MWKRDEFLMDPSSETWSTRDPSACKPWTLGRKISSVEYLNALTAARTPCMHSRWWIKFTALTWYVVLAFGEIFKASSCYKIFTKPVSSHPGREIIQIPILFLHPNQRNFSTRACTSSRPSPPEALNHQKKLLWMAGKHMRSSRRQHI